MKLGAVRQSCAEIGVATTGELIEIVGTMTVDEYLAAAPEPHCSTLAQLRAGLRESLPGATETISYGMPAIKVEGKAVDASLRQDLVTRLVAVRMEQLGLR